MDEDLFPLIWHSKESVKYAHDRPAIYFLAWRDEFLRYKIQYIGQTAILKKRLKTHESKNWWNCFKWQYASNSEKERKKREAELTEHYKPPRNKRT